MACSNCKEEGHTKTSCPHPKAEKPVKVGRPAKIESSEEPVPIHLSEEVEAKIAKLAWLCDEVALGLGKGHVEAHYQQALCVELQEQGIRYVAEEVMPIMYKGRPLGGTCNARLDVMLHSFLPFIFELKSVPSRICSVHHWQLVRYMTHKDVPYGAVVNFNQSERGSLEIQFIVRQKGAHWLYDPVTETGRPLVDFSMRRAAPAPILEASGGAAQGNSVASEATELDDLEWQEE